MQILITTLIFLASIGGVNQSVSLKEPYTTPWNDLVSVKSDFIAHFDAVVDKSTITDQNVFLTTEKDPSKHIPASLGYKPQDASSDVYLTPEKTLEYSTTYTLTFTSNLIGLVESTDAPKAKPLSFTFTTEAQPPVTQHYNSATFLNVGASLTEEQMQTAIDLVKGKPTFSYKPSIKQFYKQVAFASQKRNNLSS